MAVWPLGTPILPDHGGCRKKWGVQSHVHRGHVHETLGCVQNKDAGGP